MPAVRVGVGISRSSYDVVSKLVFALSIVTEKNPAIPGGAFQESRVLFSSSRFVPDHDPSSSRMEGTVRIDRTPYLLCWLSFALGV